jgi:uncharacterized protein (TIGR00251 family)
VGISAMATDELVAERSPSSCERSAGTSVTATSQTSSEPPAFLKPHPQGCVLVIWLQPRARREGILGPHGDALRIAVKPPPENGKANAALLHFLRELFDLPSERIRLMHGSTQRRKEVLLQGLSAEKVAELLRRWKPG